MPIFTPWQRPISITLSYYYTLQLSDKAIIALSDGAGHGSKAGAGLCTPVPLGLWGGRHHAGRFKAPLSKSVLMPGRQTDRQDPTAALGFLALNLGRQHHPQHATPLPSPQTSGGTQVASASFPPGDGQLWPGWKHMGKKRRLLIHSSCGKAEADGRGTKVQTHVTSLASQQARQSRTQQLSGHNKSSLVFSSTHSSPLKELWCAVASFPPRSALI